MKTHLIVIATVLFSLAAATSTLARSMHGSGMPAGGGGGGMTHPGTMGGTPMGTMGGLFNGYGSAYGGYSGGAATIEGSYLSGAAALAEGLGQYNFDTARAAGKFEDARRQAIDNQLLAQRSYYQLRELNKAHWLTEHPPVTPEQQSRINQSRLPRRLSPTELDTTWGVIRWPAVLERPEFTEFREQFDDAFAHRSDERFGVGTAVYSRIQTVARDMREVLDKQHTSMSQMEWIEAMRFIESLAYETRFAHQTSAESYTVSK